MKQISQETFDEVVKENMEEFDMSPEEALEDAIAQLESQGVDLSNIVKIVGDSRGSDAAAPSAGDAVQQLKDTIASLHATVVVAKQREGSAVDNALRQLNELLGKAAEMKVVAARHGAIEPLVELLDSASQDTRDRVCELLVLLCTESKENQDLAGRADAMERLARLLGSVDQSCSTMPTPALLHLLVLTRTLCFKHESNKAAFSKAQGADALCSHFAIARADDSVSKQLAAALRALTINDDPAATMSQAQDTIKLLVSRDAISFILETVKTRREAPELLSSWLIVLKQLAVTEDNCKKILELQGLELLFDVMGQYERNLTVTKRCVTVFRNVAASDEIKECIISSGGVARILEAMQLHRSDVSMQQHACATLAAISLRSPHNSTRLVDLGAARHIAVAMRTHSTDTTLLRQASLAIRNLVARSPQLRARILEEDVEDVLRQAQRYRGCGDEAYAALRDLGCSIQLSSFGTGMQPKAQFNPVNVESNKLLDAVDEAAEAPFAS
ncbi:hypothetical protein P43SY_007004 [Pythium insidiosum]|uniref:Armadillo repeat-containing protein 6 n=1 Tax=Pythium insidiosum TaxID=114742 RepID=A0AAD5M6I7_PYTIN|nr:hypothetical protein P43SY_007004 [Pythium insidiosum]